jgi:hypothetical protein
LAHIFAAARIGTDQAFALAMPDAKYPFTMQEVLDQFAKALPRMKLPRSSWPGRLA